MASAAAPSFKCTTCEVVMRSIALLKEHHKSDWHRYNLKRKLVNMPPVAEAVFVERMALFLQTVPGAAEAAKRASAAKSAQRPPGEGVAAPRGAGRADPKFYGAPTWSLFDEKRFMSSEENIAYMKAAYGFYIPFEGELEDAEGLLRFLGRRLYEGHACIFCSQRFASLKAVRHHMETLGHRGINTELLGAGILKFYSQRPPGAAQRAAVERPAIRAAAGAAGGSVEGDGAAARGGEGDAADSSAAAPGVDAAGSGADAAGSGADAAGSGSDWEDESDDDSNGSSSVGERISRLQGRPSGGGARFTAAGNLRLPRGREAAHREVAYVYKQRLPDRERAQRAAELAALTAGAVSHGGAVHRYGGTASQRFARYRLTAVAQNRARQRHTAAFGLRVGLRANRLTRSIRDPTKYFL